MIKSHITELQNEIETVKNLMAGHGDRHPDLNERASTFFKESWEDRLKRLQRDLEIEQSRRRKEIFELRLIGAHQRNH
jgi:hypothetical protein